MREPRLVPIKSGWAAVGDGWAVHGTTQEEARQLFEAAEKKHQEIDARPNVSMIPEWETDAQGRTSGRIGYRG
jgi:hypothetical protein